MRLNRYLAMCGAASRRKAEEILEQGRVRVNGKIVLLPSLQIEPGVTEVTLDGRPMAPEKFTYLVMNKPAGYVCAVADKYDSVILELLPAKFRDRRIYPVGRLDRDTEGIIILTNDGELAQRMTHPSFGITKEYEVMLDRPITDKALARWRQGYALPDSDGRVVKPIKLSRIERPGGGKENWVRVVIGEGLKREVREMVRLAGCGTERLVRTRIGRLGLSSLALGDCAEIEKEELLRKIVEGGSI